MPKGTRAFQARLVCCVLPACLAQSGPQNPPEFAVASIKPSAAQGRPAYGTGNAKAYGRNVTLKLLIGLAWQVQQFQIVGGPAWIDSDRFDVEGKTDDVSASYPQLRLMMRSLLADRFGLRLHSQTLQSPVYELVAAKGGPKIKLSSNQTPPDTVAAPASPSDGPAHGGILLGPGMLVGNAVSLSQFARAITPDLDRAVIDRTKLSGRFDLQLHWNPERGSDTLDAPSIFTAVQDQLGLKLQAARGPVDFLVVDRAEKPSGN